MGEIGEVHLKIFEVSRTHHLEDSVIGGLYLEEGEVNRIHQREMMLQKPYSSRVAHTGDLMVESQFIKFKRGLPNLASACFQWAHTPNHHRLQLGCHSGAKGPSQI